MDRRSEMVARRFEVPMLVAATLVIPTIIIEEAGPGEPLETLAVVLNYGVWLAFLVEAVVMLWIVPDKWRWAREHPLELIVVGLTPPFLLTALQPIRLLRLLRLLRFVRLAPFVRRLFTAQGLRYTAMLAFLTAIVGGAAFHQAESDQSFGKGIYWAITTMTTVGYGDLSPHTTAGRVVAIIVMLVGIGFVAIVTGAMAQAFIQPRVFWGHKMSSAEPVADDDLLAQFRELTSKMSEFERMLESQIATKAAEQP